MITYILLLFNIFIYNFQFSFLIIKFLFSNFIFILFVKFSFLFNEFIYKFIYFCLVGEIFL